MAATQVLYDYQLAPDPTTLGWLAGGPVFAYDVASGVDGMTLSPVSNAGYGGYANHELILKNPFQVGTNPLPLNPNAPTPYPSFDRLAGFSLSFRFSMNSENHTGNANRAGFSVTLLDSEHKGIEIGFQSDLIFAQNDDSGGAANMFTASTNASERKSVTGLDTFSNWNLAINANGYSLTREGAEVIHGSLRDYSAYSGIGQEAYRTTNFLFVGDNTTSAGATTTLQYLAIGPAPVPEPSAYMMLLAGLGCISLTVYCRRTVRS